ncbi:uncharacterized protein LOC131650189 [Vicia villosa]|uniref:uncharacterized protein LOC131650189 n=1 Tax=Vicia villosa TaxID=3911 RepID=UPI00273B2D06|nr:uncharacterized protein LOC131650189 [Vicia villosa]
MHALRDCSICAQVWKNVVPSDMLVEFFTADQDKWIKMNLNYRANANSNWSNIWITACHALWTWRNLEEHNEDYKRPLDPIVHILRRGKEYSQAVNLFKIVRIDYSAKNLICWKPLTKNMIKLNIDGASNSDKLGVSEGLHLLKKLGYAQVEINVDSMIVVKAIEEGKVDCLAKHSLVDRKLVIYKEAPQYVRQLLDLDDAGIVTPTVFFE